MLTEFENCIKNTMPDGLYSIGLDIIQVNLGLLCNQACNHCHVQASPLRREIMQPETMELILKAVSGLKCRYVELTGGTPELNPYFKWFVRQLKKKAGQIVQVRTNLTVLVEPHMEETLSLFREHKIRLVASMPCYLEENVNSQRGGGVYEKSVEAMKKLNALGYGKKPELTLDLVYNPGGPFLPPPQQALETDYKRELAKRFGLVFNNLITITNMPIGRFIAKLEKQHKDIEYRNLLQNTFNPLTLENLMCRHQVSIGWEGSLYDCDFNLALGIGLNYRAPANIRDFDVHAISGRKIMTGNHCFGCTAGCGSSCTGRLA